DPLLQTVLYSLKAGEASSPLLESVLRVSSGLGEMKPLMSLLEVVATPENGKYARWQLDALAGLLDALDQRNTPLSRLARNDDGTLKPILQRLGGLFDAARTAAVNQNAELAERVLATRLLGRGIDHEADDLKLLSS